MRNNQWLLSDILGLLCVSLITRSYPHVFFVFSLTAQRKWALYFFQCYHSCTLDVKGQINCAAATIWSHRVLSHMGLFLSQNLGYWCLKWLDETCKKWKSFCLLITGSCTASTQWFWPVIRHCFVSQSGKNGEQIWKWCGLLGFLQSCCCKSLWLKADGLAGKSWSVCLPCQNWKLQLYNFSGFSLKPVSNHCVACSHVQIKREDIPVVFILWL